ncbi:phosphoenolpyruvate synthase [Microcella frigidaquae]|uniref:Phosphoenolpyruvate synthase n=1 Tax=Microcella frigidaquae TaxID=424758 RepID=A0A840XC16_9MICO|nr:phosphoenolpyruvate synthase [Microcella frigidaquae]MBB5618575.1 pyruvate,water dikinase [Microcella frigidaquae]NHN44011.1 phosphoenolpyruvate synthase [Microcella frigidaquae]
MTDILWFDELGMADVPQVGGKNASLGEMVSKLGHLGVRVPGGFATTADAYHRFLAGDGLYDRIMQLVLPLDVGDVTELARVGATIRGWIERQPFPAELEESIRTAYDRLIANDPDPAAVSWAVRSSATAEDLPDASFAGQQETFLNISGIDNLLQAIRSVFASLFNDRAIAYRVHNGFAHDEVALSAGVQRMVRSDVGASGVMFSIDTESGFTDAVLITSSYGLGEAVVQGAVNPDEFSVYKPGLRVGRPAILSRTLGAKAVKMIYAGGSSMATSTVFTDVDPVERSRFSLTDAEVHELARHALTIEEHYGRAMDIEWARDGVDGLLYILQARPETVVSRREGQVLTRYAIGGDAAAREVVIAGRAIGQKVGAGPVRVLTHIDRMSEFAEGDVLVADMTDPDWEPIMKRASAIVTNRGGRTCHAAIIARELGIPAVVGTGTATSVMTDGQEVTVSCAEGDEGRVYAGRLPFEVVETALDAMPEPPTKIMMNLGTPDQAFALSHLPNRGVGLARLEFIINRQVGVHPRALLERDLLPAALQQQVDEHWQAYPSPREFFISRVAEGVATIAAAFAPEPVIVRLSDFKSNEYANLVGGDRYEPREENPMLGYRGASRYVSEDFAEAFALECAAMKRVRDDMGLTNLELMVPFVRTVGELEAVIQVLADNGLKRGENGLRIIMMCEIPSNAISAAAFLEHVDGFSIGSNDLTQLTLGVDRDSALVAGSFDERDPAVLTLLGMAIDACQAAGKYIGICGQGPSDHPDLAEWLVDRGIGSMSLNPDTVVETWLRLANR